MGAFPGGMGNNRDYFAPWVRFDDDVSDTLRQLLWTPETSGGILAAVAPENVAEFVRLCPEAVEIGHVVPGDGHIRVSHG